jgi:AraC-like DNA-binding protein
MASAGDGPVSDYREFPAPPPLAGHLFCLWTQSISETPCSYAQRVLPDGCIDIVLINDDSPMVVGPWSEPFIARLAPGTTIVGARFYPGRAPGLLGLPASELLNQSVRLCDVWGSAVETQFARIAQEAGLPARRSAIVAALLDRLAHPAPLDHAVIAAVQWLAKHPNGQIEQLSRLIGISSRQLHRRFSDAVGYGPKMFQSVARFQSLVHLASPRNNNRDNTRALVQLSADAGYSDQAHMTREVRRFSGVPPARLLRFVESPLRMSGLIGEPA